MKRWIALLLALLIAFSMGACGSGSSTDYREKPKKEAEVSSESTLPTWSQPQEESTEEPETTAPQPTTEATTQPERVPETTVPPVADRDTTLAQIQAYLEEHYFDMRNIEILDMEVYHETDSMIVITVVTTDTYAVYGVDYYKDNREIKFYKTGNFVFSGILP